MVHSKAVVCHNTTSVCTDMQEQDLVVTTHRQTQARIFQKPHKLHVHKKAVEALQVGF